MFVTLPLRVALHFGKWLRVGRVARSELGKNTNCRTASACPPARPHLYPLICSAHLFADPPPLFMQCFAHRSSLCERERLSSSIQSFLSQLKFSIIPMATFRIYLACCILFQSVVRPSCPIAPHLQKAQYSCRLRLAIRPLRRAASALARITCGLWLWPRPWLVPLRMRDCNVRHSFRCSKLLKCAHCSRSSRKQTFAAVLFIQVLILPQPHVD